MFQTSEGCDPSCLLSVAFGGVTQNGAPVGHFQDSYSLICSSELGYSCAFAYDEPGSDWVQDTVSELPSAALEDSD